MQLIRALGSMANAANSGFRMNDKSGGMGMGRALRKAHLTLNKTTQQNMTT